jgi:hypothetical protein
MWQLLAAHHLPISEIEKEFNIFLFFSISLETNNNNKAV